MTCRATPPSSRPTSTRTTPPPASRGQRASMAIVAPHRLARELPRRQREEPRPPAVPAVQERDQPDQHGQRATAQRQAEREAPDLPDHRVHDGTSIWSGVALRRRDRVTAEDPGEELAADPDQGPMPPGRPRPAPRGRGDSQRMARRAAATTRASARSSSGRIWCASTQGSPTRSWRMIDLPARSRDLDPRQDAGQRRCQRTMAWRFRDLATRSSAGRRVGHWRRRKSATGEGDDRASLAGGGRHDAAAGALGGEDLARRELVLDRGAYAQPPPRQPGPIADKGWGEPQPWSGASFGGSEAGPLLRRWTISARTVVSGSRSGDTATSCSGSGSSPHGHAASVTGCRRGDKPHQDCVVTASPDPIAWNDPLPRV